MVPSSTTVTPLAATCWPMRPAKADVFLRLKSPSSPWPTASCSITPGQRLDETLEALAPTITVAAGFLPRAVARDDRHIEADQRAHVAIHFAVGAQDFHDLP